MKNPILFVLFFALCIAFGALALCQDKMFAVLFAIACLLFAGYLELSNKSK